MPEDKETWIEVIYWDESKHKEMNKKRQEMRIRQGLKDWYNKLPEDKQ